MLGSGLDLGLGEMRDSEISDGAAMIFVRSTSRGHRLSRWSLELENDEWW